ncbi:MAG: pyridoxal-phosphate dependent enzyme [Gemmatimonadetes bacterium]|nr:pyridoxal-phosphate dependent enzyme [Gemmatimonadota bacterium]
MKGDRSLGRFETVLDTIGDTPLIRLNRVTDDARTPVWIKVESFNPGGSVKDRIGLAIIEAAEREGRLAPGGTVVEGTAGNTGVGLAIAAAVKGYRCVFAIPEKMSAEKIRMVKAYGAEVVVTPTGVGPDDPEYYGNVARRIAEETPGAVLADQFFNPVNPEAHYETTGPEIWDQTDGQVTHLVAAPATGGTISGAARFLKERNPDLQVVAGDPVGSIFAGYFATGEKGGGAPYKVEGVGNDKIPSTLDFDVIDEFMKVSDRDAFHMARRLTREEGLFAGGSSGLIVHVAVELARRVDDPTSCIVCLLTDTGERYLTKLYNDEWMRENQMLPSTPATAAALLEQKRAAGAPDLIAVAPSDPVSRGLELIDEHHVSQMPVIDNGNSIGAVTEAKLMAAVIRRPEQLGEPIGSLAGAPFPAVPPDADPTRLTHELSRESSAVLVADATGILGVLTRYDLFQHMLSSGEVRSGG